MNRTNLKIDGMSCGHCVASVKNTLSALDGVQVEQVSVGQATIAYDPATTPMDRITKAIEDEGYSVVSTN